MLRLIGENLGPAFAATVSPIPLIGLTVILTSKKGVVGGLAFAVGWFLAVFLGILVFGLLGQAAASSDQSATDTGISFMSVAIGVLFLYLAWRNFQNRNDHAEPSWLGTVDEMSVPKIFGLGLVAELLNAKNLPLFASIGGALAAAAESAGESTGTLVGAGLVLAAVGSIIAIVAVGLGMFAGESGQRALSAMRQFLIENNHVIMMVLFGYLGAAQLGRALDLFG